MREFKTTRRKGIRTSAEDRLMNHVLKTETCWLWLGYKDKQGYGKILEVDKKCIGCHRVSYQKFKGPIPEGLDILHTCDNPSCVNPDHLKLGSHLENMWDMLSKNRFPFQKLTISDIHTIRKLYKTGKYTQQQIGDKYKVLQCHISRIVNNNTRKYAISVT